jgi:adenylate cyclase
MVLISSENIQRFYRSSPVKAALLSVSVCLVLVGLRSLGGLESLELAAYDWFIRLRPIQAAPESRIVVIGVTEREVREYGWPLSDGVLAQALQILGRFEPRAIGIDIYRDIPLPPGSETLNRILQTDRRIVVVRKFAEGSSTGVAPPAVLKDTDQVGFNDVMVDPGGIVRRGLLFLDDGTTTLYSFGLRLALLYLSSEGIQPQPNPQDPQQMRLGRTTIRPFEANDGGYVNADARGYQFLLDFNGGAQSFTSAAFSDLLSGAIKAETLRDKIVLIGITAESVKDQFYTPYSRGLGENQDTPGVAIHAQITSQLLRMAIEGSAPIKTLSGPLESVWFSCWGILGGFLGFKVRSPWRFALVALAGFLALTGIDFIAFLKGWWIPYIPVAAAWFGAAGVVIAYLSYREMVERDALMKLFSRHVSKQVANAIWQQRDQFLDGHRPRPQRLIATALITDLVGFTTVSEKLSPDVLMDWLNEYMEGMTRDVSRHGGVIEQYAGDSIVAIFGVPIPRRNDEEIGADAVRAVRCALAMEATLKSLNRNWQAQGRPTTAMRIGIFTGPVVAGTVGSEERAEYLAIGDTVNVASRLESFSKNLIPFDIENRPCRILIGEATLRYLNNQFATEKIGEAMLKGKQEKTAIYRILGGTEELSTHVAEDESALDYYPPEER